MFQINFNEFKLNKVFLELRYKDVFSLPTPEKRYSILDKLAKKYPDYNSDTPDRISFFDHERKLQIHININRLIIDWDKPASFKDFEKVSVSVINDINKILHIEQPLRIGIRTFFTYKVEDPIHIFNYITNRFFSANSKPTELIADEIFTPNVRFSGRKGTLKFNLSIGYQQEQIIEGHLTQPIQSILNHNFLVDIDTYKEDNINLNRLEKFFSDTDEFVNQKIFDYLKKVEG